MPTWRELRREVLDAGGKLESTRSYREVYRLPTGATADIDTRHLGEHPTRKIVARVRAALGLKP